MGMESPTLWVKDLRLADIPVTCSLVAVCLGVSSYFLTKDLSTSAISSSYVKVIDGKEYWRIFTGWLVHADVMHLVFNILTLWANKELEVYFGSMVYFQRTILLLLLTNTMHLLYVDRICKEETMLERLRYNNWVGISGVLFGWFGIYVSLPFWSADDTAMLLGFVPVPIESALFVFLVLEFAVSGKSCSTNNCFGMLAGLFIAVGAFEWIDTYFFFCLLQWCILLMLRSKGFPPKLESMDVARQRRLEAEYAAAASSRQSDSSSNTSASAGNASDGADSNQLESESILCIEIEIPPHLRERVGNTESVPIGDIV